MYRVTCLIFLALFSFVQSFAQEAPIVETDSVPARTSLWEDLKYDGGSVYKGVLHVYSRPAHWKKDDWLTA